MDIHRYTVCYVVEFYKYCGYVTVCNVGRAASGYFSLVGDRLFFFFFFLLLLASGGSFTISHSKT